MISAPTSPMEELAIHGTIWLSLAGYFVCCALQLRSPASRVARWAWTIGALACVAHILCAFAFRHQWSHASAVAETARQTAAVTGLNWGGGVYVNHLFAAVWIADALWWWFRPEGYQRRQRWVIAAVHGFFIFMIFNGAVVFARGNIRWITLACLVALALAARQRLRA